MSDNAITVVSGFGRCGTSLVMQMLEAGGMPVTGQWPAFEAPEAGVTVSGGKISADWLRAHQGHAIKALDPQNGHIPDGFSYRVVWCSREHREQARSQAKIMRVLFGKMTGRDQVRALERSYSSDKPAAIRSLLKCRPLGILEVRFETLLRDPIASAGEISDYCGGLDVPRMAGAVKPRSSQCATGMDMELALMDERKQAA